MDMANHVHFALFISVYVEQISLRVNVFNILNRTFCSSGKSEIWRLYSQLCICYVEYIGTAFWN